MDEATAAKEKAPSINGDMSSAAPNGTSSPPQGQPAHGTQGQVAPPAGAGGAQYMNYGGAPYAPVPVPGGGIAQKPTMAQGGQPQGPYGDPPSRFPSGQSISQQGGPTPTLNSLLQGRNAAGPGGGQQQRAPGPPPGPYMNSGPGYPPWGGAGGPEAQYGGYRHPHVRK